MAEKEYIERETAVRAVTTTPVRLAIDKIKVIRTVEELQAADVVEVRHGEWKNDGKDWFCNRCNRNALCDKMTGEEVLSAICPNCGAKMDGKGEGE